MRMRHLTIACLSIFVALNVMLAGGCQLIQKTGETMVTTTTPSAPINTEWKPPALSLSGNVLPSIADVVANVKPSVVAINVKAAGVDFFNRPITEEGAGSGFIISQDGLVITNNHVVANASSVEVVLDNGSTYAVDLSTIHTDEFTDLAVMKIDATGLPAAKIGDSGKLRVGDFVVAIGNSLGQGIRATLGIVSRQNASLDAGQGQMLSGLIETDAAINPGNSGGPLVNMAGEVVGITSAKIADVGVEGVGYAISTNEAMPIIDDLISSGYVVRPWLGVGMYSVDTWAAFRYRLAVDQGVLVTEVVSGSPGSGAGLRAGDVIVRFNGENVTTVAELTNTILKTSIGQEVEVVFWRGNNQRTAKAVMAESPKP
jgi:serine protease Do